MEQQNKDKVNGGRGRGGDERKLEGNEALPLDPNGMTLSIIPLIPLRMQTHLRKR